MKSRIFKILLVFLFGAVFIASSTFAEGEGGNKNKQLNKPTGQPIRAFMNINNISTVIKNAGTSDIDVGESNSGLVFPRGSGKTAIFISGLIWGAKIDGDPQVRVGGSTYREGVQPGAILPDGTVEATDAAHVRIYRVRPDVFPGGPSVNLIVEATDEGKSEAAVRAQYETDWTEWPAEFGAPYDDIDGNGSYDPTVDIPGFIGADQTIWYVANDQNASKTTNLYGTNPLGIEMQVTFWAYSQAGALGNMFFRKYVLINKSDVLGNPQSFNDMYVSMWSDPDIGNSVDDFAGSDTVLSLSYAYNSSSSDATYDPLPPPAIGFDFFQGPIVESPGDTAIFNGEKRPGFKNLPMTASYYFARGDASVVDPELGTPQGANQFYNFMQGKIGLTGDFFVDPVTGLETTFTLTGDPATGEGWIDGMLIGPSDRRIGAASGPFVMAPGDTQEVVVAEICAGATVGVNFLAAVDLLKAYDKIAQDAYDNFFQLPKAPKRPKVDIVELDKEIILNWGSDVDNVFATESHDDKGYKFEGYNIYQLPSSSAAKNLAIRLATYDVVNGIKTVFEPEIDPTSGELVSVPRQFGTDSGIERFIQVTKNAFDNTPLVNGIKYYFAVTAYAVTEDSIAVPKSLENPLLILTIIPQGPVPGTRYSQSPGDTLATEHLGVSNGSVVPIVVDPTALNGHSYEVTFKDVEGQTLWDLTDITANEVKLSDQSNQSGDNDYLIVDGLMVKVIGPALLGVDWDYEGERWLSGNSDNGGDLMFGSVFVGPNFWGETTVAPGDLVDLHVDVFDIDSYDDANGNGSYDVGEIYTAVPDSGQLVNLYETWGAGFWSSQQFMPMKFFDVTSDPPRQLTVIVRDRDQNGQWDPDDGTIQYNYIFVLDDDYDPTGNNWNPNAGGRDFMDEILVNGGPVLWSCWWVPRGTREQFSAPFTMDFIAPKVNTPDDAFIFTATENVNSTDLAREDIKNINVFPNPYYGVNSEEVNKYQRFVTFTHLPDKATIRIFNLAGVLIRTIDKNEPGQYQRWDLANDAGLPVASGLYIAYIELPDLGETKILKIAVVQEQQILDRF